MTLNTLGLFYFHLTESTNIAICQTTVSICQTVHGHRVWFRFYNLSGLNYKLPGRLKAPFTIYMQNTQISLAYCVAYLLMSEMLY